MTAKQQEELLAVLQVRFERFGERHEGVGWAEVEARLRAHPERLGPLHEMERTGGEPDMVGRGGEAGELLFFDCAPESPAGRRSLCYDEAALESRKKDKPGGSAMGMAAAMGIEVLSEAQYRELQRVGRFDTKTSSWIQTPDGIRGLGGALFGDRRYEAVFVYHNGAESYYAARGFRGVARV